MHYADLIELTRLPRTSINLMLTKTADNDPFYARVVDNFYKEATSRHPKYLFIRKYRYDWANIGFCRHYRVEHDSIVIGPVWTSSDMRGHGLAPAAMQKVTAYFSRCGYHRFYVDTTIDNHAARRMIGKAGFQELMMESAFERLNHG